LLTDQQSDHQRHAWNSADQYKSIDKIDSDDPEEIANYPTKIPNTFNVSGIPTHVLKLKVGAIIRALRENLIVADIAADNNKGHTVYIPRITLSPTDSDLPLILKRLQFPVLLAIVITITKSQGQTFDRVGIFLPEPVFSHGQLYVAFSRATSKEGSEIIIIDFCLLLLLNSMFYIFVFFYRGKNPQV
jgi:hypothetical protein